MKKILALLLALCLLLALAACGGGKPAPVAPAAEGNAEPAAAPEPAPAPTPAPTPETTPEPETFSVVGAWVAEIDLAKALAAEPDTAAMFGEDPAVMELRLVFAEDGSVRAEADMDETLPALKAAMLPAMTRMIEEDYGMTVEDFEAAAGMTLEEMVDSSMAAILDEDSMREYFADAMSGSYTVDGDTVTVVAGGGETVFTVRDGALVTEAEGLGELVFIRT